jgi:hypothetical protein
VPVNVRAGYLYARFEPRVGDREILARDEDADLALRAPKDRLPVAERDDHAAGLDPDSDARCGGRALCRPSRHRGRSS